MCGSPPLPHVNGSEFSTTRMITWTQPAAGSTRSLAKCRRCAHMQQRRGNSSTKNSKTVALTRQQSRFWHGMDSIRRAALNLVFAAIYAILFIQTARGVYSIGEMVLLIQLVTMARQPVSMMSWIIDSTQHALAGSRDYFGVMSLSADAREGIEMRETSSVREDMKLDVTSPPISFRNVTFSYDTGNPVLSNISFEHPNRGAGTGFCHKSGWRSQLSTPCSVFLLPMKEELMIRPNTAD